MNSKWAFITPRSIAASLLVALILAACVAPEIERSDQPRSTSDTTAETVEKVSVPAAHSDQPRLTPDAFDTEIEALASGINAFAFDLYQAIRGGEDNLIFSPFGISQALAMVYAGARGKTAEQMADTLHFTLPQECLHPAFNALDQELASRAREAVGNTSGQSMSDSAFELHVTNAIWGQKGLPYRPEYLAVLAQNYGSGVQFIDLKGNPDAAVAETNRVASQETGGRIPEMKTKLPKDTRLVVVSIISFNAARDLPFKESNTYREPFHLLDGHEKSVPMMHQRNRFRYTEGDSFQAIQLPYLNRTVAMVILLPREGLFREIEQQLTGERVQGIVGSLGEQNVILTMPKFTYAPELPLNQVLENMGMPDAFREGVADFSGMLEKPESDNVRIEEVLHKCFIDLDERKTKAEAVTEIIIEKFISKGDAASTPVPIVMKIDRPFIFVIRDIKTNTILFVGRVTNPVP
jgi:serpin B